MNLYESALPIVSATFDAVKAANMMIVYLNSFVHKQFTGGSTIMSRSKHDV